MCVSRVLYRRAALADGRSPHLRLAVSVLTDGDTISWIRPSDSEPNPGPRSGLEVVDARGATIVPGMVDAHSHVTLPGGANWHERVQDAIPRLLANAERNGVLALESGVRWIRDPGSPTRKSPDDGTTRALTLVVRDRWAGRRDRPYIVSAGTWISAPGVRLSGTGIEVSNSDQLLAAATLQLDRGADLVKLYVQSLVAGASPWSANEIKRVTDAVHARGAKVTAHCQSLAPARAAVHGGVDSIEHGFVLDTALCDEMVTRGTFLVSTLTVWRSILAMGTTTTGFQSSGKSGRRSVQRLLDTAEESVRKAHTAGVKIAAGTDAGGGSSRANHMAWEIGSLVAAGLEPWEALGAATWRGGELMDHPTAGTISDGGPADFFLVHGDPLSDPSALWRVWRVA